MASVPPTIPPTIVYPESDGLPMSENTKQFDWIQLLAANLKILFATRDDVFVSGNQFWYPVEGRPDINQSPDVYVIFGRPKGDRRSYKQWEESDVPMTVVFEILSPSNTGEEMRAKLSFYEEYGVEEYYIYDPLANKATVYLRKGSVLRRHRPVQGIVSPRLGIRFELTNTDMIVYYPDGRTFLSPEQFDQVRREAESRATTAETQLARVLHLSRKVRQGQASGEELAELEQLEGEQRSPNDA